MGVDRDDEFASAIERDAALVQSKHPSDWFAYWLKELRAEREWSVADLAVALIDLGSTEVSPRLLEDIESSEIRPTIDLVVHVALVFGVAPLSLMVGVYGKDQVYLPLGDGPEYLASEHSFDFAKWFAGLEPNHWSGVRRDCSTDSSLRSAVQHWVLDGAVPRREYEAQRERVVLLENALSDLEAELRILRSTGDSV